MPNEIDREYSPISGLGLSMNRGHRDSPRLAGGQGDAAVICQQRSCLGLMTMSLACRRSDESQAKSPRHGECSHGQHRSRRDMDEPGAQDNRG